MTSGSSPGIFRQDAMKRDIEPGIAHALRTDEALLDAPNLTIFNPSQTNRASAAPLLIASFKVNYHRLHWSAHNGVHLASIAFYGQLESSLFFECNSAVQLKI